MVTDETVKLYRKYRGRGLSREAAAARAGMSPKTARKYEVGPMPSTRKKPRDYRTRPDPFAQDWQEFVVPLLQRDADGTLQAKTVLDELKVQRPEHYGDGHLRTLQRRFVDWRAMHGPAKEVFFPQEHVPGREGQFDFTHATELQVSIGGELLEHLFFEFILSYSGWRYVQIAYSENFEALTDGLQEAFWELGGVPHRARHDSLSAATQQLVGSSGRKLTPRFAAFLEHYGVASKPINVGQANENGVAESGHATLKSALEQALFMRGSKEFPTLQAYLEFVHVVVARLNHRHRESLEEERRHLRPLPFVRLPSYADTEARVSRWSVIQAARQIYSVPSRLIGLNVTVRLHPTEVEILYKGQSVQRGPRLRGKGARRVDYRHVIHSLVRKPGAFACYRFREELFPTLTFRRAYDALCARHGERGDVHYVRILHLAATTMECEVEAALQVLMDSEAAWDFRDVQALVVMPAPAPAVELLEPFTPDLNAFDVLLKGDYDVANPR